MKFRKLAMLILLPIFSLSSCNKPSPTTSSIIDSVSSISTSGQNSTPTPITTSVTTPSTSTPSTSIPPTSAPSTSISSTSTPSYSTPSTTPAIEEDWSTPIGRHAIFQNTEIGAEGVYVMGQVMKLEQYNYSLTHNIYLNDGPYTYQVLNVPLSENAKVGDFFMLGGKKRQSPSYGSRIEFLEDAGAVRIGEDELDSYGMVSGEVKTVATTSEVSLFPAIVNINNLTLISRDSINPSDSFDKGTVVVKSGELDITIEVLGSLINGNELATIFSKILIGSTLGINNLILFSPTLARVASAEDIDFGENGDELIVDSVLAGLNISSNVANDLSLQTSVLGATVTWSSSDESVISTNGVVKRPDFGSSPASVRLTATVTKGAVTKTKTFDVTVPAKTNQDQEGDLFIYVYMEGSGSNKLIGLKNGSSSQINLSAYTVSVYVNGETTPSGNNILTLPSMILESGEVFYFYNNSMSTTIKEKLDTNYSMSDNNKITNFNGNDVISLSKNGTIIDLIGTIGSSTNFPVSDGKTCKDSTLVRSSTINSGTGSFITSEWLVYDTDQTPFLD